MSGRLTVLGWHPVEGSWCFPVPPLAGRRGLRRQLLALARTAEIVPLESALADLRAGRPLRRRSIALTFDDGYRDHLEVAAPLLEEIGLPATFFLVPGLLSGSTRAWWEVAGRAFARSTRERIRWEEEDLDLGTPAARRDAFERVGERLKRRDHAARDAAVAGLVAELLPGQGTAGDPPAPEELFLDWRGARALVRRGFAVGSHTMEHAVLSQESPEEQRRDLAESRDVLERELQIPIRLLAYPNGTVRDYDRTTVAAAGAAGYDHAVTARPGRNDGATPPYDLRRLIVSPTDGAREIMWAVRDLVRGTDPVEGL